MLGYAMAGTKDLNKAAEFFDNVLKVLGAKRLMDEETFIVWGRSMEETSFSICLPYNGEAAVPGNGTMISFLADSKEQVDALYNAAIENGATCEGEPGVRWDTFYAGYFRDLDGNKFNAFYHKP